MGLLGIVSSQLRGRAYDVIIFSQYAEAIDLGLVNYIIGVLGKSSCLITDLALGIDEY
jgi:hypothetical protein